MQRCPSWRVVRRLGLAVFLTAAVPVAGADEPAPQPTPSASPASAEPAASPKAPAIEITGFVDTYYGYNLNRPGGDGQLRNFDTKHNQLSPSLIELALEQKPTAESRLGFRADLDFGPVTETVHAAEPGGTDIFKTFEQGYLSYLAPAGRGLQLDVGKFVTPHGAEVIEAKDNWNYSRSLLFALAIPYYHVGLRATYPFSDKLTLAGYAVNGWNNAVDNNGGKTFGVQAVIKAHPRLTVTQNFMRGAEQTNDTADKRFLFDTVLAWSATDRLSFMVNYDYAGDRVAGTDVRWHGVAGYARLQVFPVWALAARVERLSDPDGFMTGAEQTLKGVTFTTEHKVSGGLITRLEWRRDTSDGPFFAKGEDKVKAQSTFTLGLVYAFSSRF